MSMRNIRDFVKRIERILQKNSKLKKLKQLLEEEQFLKLHLKFSSHNRVVTLTNKIKEIWLLCIVGHSNTREPTKEVINIRPIITQQVLHFSP